MTFLLDNPNRLKQYGYPRRGGGFTAPQIAVHTYEAPHTRSLVAAATYLLQRTNHGSYHALAGARSPQDVLQLAPWSYETWHSTPNNNWAIGVSAVAYAHQWDTIPSAARDNLVKSMAYSASQAAKWLQDAHGRVVEPRFLTRAQAMRKESGFVMHSTMDPGRRSDAGATFPRAEFLAEFNRLMADTTTPAASTEGELTMSDIKKIEDALAAMPGRVLQQEITVQRSGKPKAITVQSALQNLDSGLNANYGTALANSSKIVALESIVTQLAEATGTPIDWEKVAALVEESSEQGVLNAAAAGLELEITVTQKEN